MLEHRKTARYKIPAVRFAVRYVPERVTTMTRPLVKSSQGRQLPFCFNGSFGGLETDLAVSTITEWLVDRSSAAAE